MAGDFRAVQAGLTQGFQIGQRVGGRLGGLGSTIKKVANRLKSQREGGEALETLGKTERIKAGIKKEFAGPSRFGQEALAFEEAKAGILKRPQAIVDPESFEVVGERPKGSIFQPRGEKLSQAERTIIGNIRALKEQKVPLEEIKQMIQFEGYDPESDIFQGELTGYSILPRPSLAKRATEFIGRVSPF